jgi:RNA polymerase sigma-70 factor (ECF subfamily)
MRPSTTSPESSDASGPNPPTADLALVRQALRGDAAAIDALVERLRCVARILTTVNLKLGRPLRDDELEDLAQDAMVAMWRKLEDYDGRAALETWSYGFCTFEVLRRLRKTSAARGVVELDRVEVVTVNPEILDFEHVRAGLDALEPEERAVLELKHFEDLTFEGIAQRLAVPANTAKTRYYRGLSKLRARLAVNARSER